MTQRIIIEETLPCGHVLGQAWVRAGDHPLTMEDLRNAHDVMKYWVQDRTNKHRCELVSPENPAGSITVAEKLKKNALPRSDEAPV